MKSFHKILRPLKSKMFAEKCFNYAIIGLSAGAAACICVILTAKFVYFPSVDILTPSFIFAGGVIGIIAAMIKTPDYFAAASAGDALGFKERFVTALEAYVENRNDSASHLVIADALKTAETNNLAKMYKIQIKRKLLYLLAILIALMFVTGFIPGPNADTLAQRAALSAKIAEEIKALENKKEDLQKELTESEAKKLDDAVKKLEAELKKSETEAEAVKTLLKAQETLKKISKESVGKDLKAIGEKLSSSEATRELGEALQNGDSEKIKENIEGLAEFLRNATEEELNAFIKALQEMAEMLSNESELAAALNELSNIAASGDFSELDSALNELAKQLDKAMGENSALRDALEKYNEALSQSASKMDSAGKQAQSGQSQQGQSQSGQSQSGQSGQSQSGQSQSGQSSQSQPGQNQQGQSGQGQSQQGQGQSGQNGQGQNGQGQGQGGQNNAGGSGRGSGHVENESIYKRDAQGYADYETNIDGTENQGGQTIESERKGIGSAGESVPYEQVFNEYKEEALKTLEDYSIPYGMKELVKEYFSSLE